MYNSVPPHRRQPNWLPCPWDSPGKNTGVSCHFLLQYMKVKSESEVAQSCPTLSDPMDCSLPGTSVRGIFQTREGLPTPIFLPGEFHGQRSQVCYIPWGQEELETNEQLTMYLLSLKKRKRNP